MKHLDLFSGIGGFALAVDSVWPKMKHIFVEHNQFCQAVLKKTLSYCHDGVDDGLRERLVRLPDGTAITHAKWRKEALKACGNAIVPAVAMEIFRSIRNY